MKLIYALIALICVTAINAQTIVIDDFSNVGTVSGHKLPNPLAVTQSVVKVSPEHTADKILRSLLPIDDRNKQIKGEGEALSPHTTQLGIGNMIKSGKASGPASGNRGMLITNQPWYEKAAPITSYVSANIENGYLAVHKQMDSAATWVNLGYRYVNENDYKGTLKMPARNWGLAIDVAETTHQIEVIISVTVSMKIRTGDRNNPTAIDYVNVLTKAKIGKGRSFFKFNLNQFYDEDKVSLSKQRGDSELDAIKISHIIVSTRTPAKESKYAINQISISRSANGIAMRNNTGQPVYDELQKFAVLPDGEKVEVDNAQE